MLANERTSSLLYPALDCGSALKLAYPARIMINDMTAKMLARNLIDRKIASVPNPNRS